MVRIQLFGAWEAITFVLNGIVFALIGLQMQYVLAGIRGNYSMATLVGYGAVFSVMLIALRMIWVAPAVWLSSFVARLKHKETISTRETFVIGWTGMRGVIALAAAISVPEVINGRPVEARNLIVFLTFCVILVTLVLQGLTLPPVIRALGLAGHAGMEPEERYARQVALREALRYLEEGKEKYGEQNLHAFDDLIDRYRHRLCSVGLDDAGPDTKVLDATKHMVELTEGALRRERAAVIRLRDAGEISDEVLRTVERELDLEESRYLVKKY
jgi:CPA1 family monovalent cation:H+ antiporter